MGVSLKAATMLPWPPSLKGRCDAGHGNLTHPMIAGPPRRSLAKLWYGAAREWSCAAAC